MIVLLHLQSRRQYLCMCVCGCVRACCMSAVQPQHPDEVSLIGSLWDSSAAFHSEPAHCQQSALTEPESKTKDGTCFSLSFSFHTHTQAYSTFSTHKHTTISHQNACVSFQWSVLECWDESGSHNYSGLPKCLHPRLPSKVIGCVFLRVSPPNLCSSCCLILHLTQTWKQTAT